MKKFRNLGYFLMVCICLLACGTDENEQEKGVEGTLVGTWVGAIGYSCSNNDKHEFETGKIWFNADGTGAVKYDDVEEESDIELFRYENNTKEKKIDINFDDGRYVEFQYTELTNDQIVYIDKCRGCGEIVTMILKRHAEISKIVVTSSEGYKDTYQYTYDNQSRISKISYASVGDGNVSANIQISYTGNQVKLTGGVLDDYPYSVVYTLNNNGTVKKAVSTLQIPGNVVTNTLDFTYNPTKQLSTIHSTESSSNEPSTNSVTLAWVGGKLNNTGDRRTGEDILTNFTYQSELTPNISINLSYFMIFRYDDDMVYSGDNAAIFYASMLDMLGAGASQLMKSALRSGNGWGNSFQFNYNWDENGRLTGINDRSTYSENNDSSEDNIAISYIE